MAVSHRFYCSLMFGVSLYLLPYFVYASSEDSGKTASMVSKLKCFFHYLKQICSSNFGRLFVCFVALCPKSTAMVIAGWSVHLTTLFPGQA